MIIIIIFLIAIITLNPRFFTSLSLLLSDLKRHMSTPYPNNVDDSLSVLSPGGVLLFRCGQEECRMLCRAVSHFKPSFRCAKTYDNVNVVLEYRNKIGNLFQLGEGVDRINVLESGANFLSDTIVLQSFDVTSVPIVSASSSMSDASSADDYDFDKCYVQAVLVQKYENTFPFNFYVDDDLCDTFSSNASNERAVEESLRTAVMEDPARIAEAIDSTVESAIEPSSLTPPKNIVYKFEHFFGQNEGDDDVAFPHCIYSSSTRGRGAGFIPVFGGTSSSQIENGTITTGFTIGNEAGTLNEPCTFFHPSHALYDVLRAKCAFYGTHLVGIRRVTDEEESAQIADEEGNTDVFSVKPREKRFEAFVVDETVDRWIKQIPLDGFFCPSLIVSMVLTEYQKHVLPMVSKRYDIKDLSTIPATFYKNGVSFKDYVANPMDDTLERFEENYLSQERHVKVHLKVSILAFPKDHDKDQHVMCCDI